MKTNKLLKVLSAATIISTLAVVDYSTTAQNNKVLLAADTQNPEVEVPTTALNAYEAGKTSMAAASIVKLTVQKVSNGYKYKLILKDIKVGNLTDGVSKLWIEGQEISLQTIEYPKDSNVINPKLAEFTLSELKPKINATVFVKVMEDLGMLANNPGQGKKDTILSLDLTGVQEKLTPKADESKPAESSNVPTTSSQPTTPAKPTETTPSPKPETHKDTQPSDKLTETGNTKPVDTAKPAETPKPKDQPKTGTNPGDQPTSPITTPTTPLPAPTQEQSEERTVTYFDNVTVSLLNAYESGRASMGNAALDGITVYKDGSTYHYKVRFHDIKVGTLTDGITRFWVNGTEYPVNRTGGAMNQVQVHFTSPEKLTNIPVSVFVPTMESIMPGAGKKDAILSLNWSNATERQGTAVIDGGQPGASAAGNGASALTSKGGRLNNGRLSNTGLETSSSIFAGALTLMSAFLVGRRKQK